MNSLNLFLISLVNKNNFRPAVAAMSNDNSPIKGQEYEDISALVGLLENEGADIWDLNDFWYSYCIPHISKEFDLLKLAPGRKLLNIELKSRDIGEAGLKKQLMQNQMYLKHLNTPIESFVFISDEHKLYRLVKDDIEISCFAELLGVIREIKEDVVYKNLDEYFKPEIFLVSPLAEPYRFLNYEYFLTGQQENFKKDILRQIYNGGGIFGITGEPGTGKTLLLYDLALALMKSGRCCIIHGSVLCEGHRIISDCCENIDVFSAGDYSTNPEIIAGYDYILIDEAQRLFSFIDADKPILMCFDNEGSLTGHIRDNRGVLSLRDSDVYREFRLTNSLRANKNISSFYKLLFNLSEYPKGKCDFSGIDILFASDIASAGKIIKMYCDKYGFKYIRLADNEDIINDAPGFRTEEIIGQEFDRVITIIDSHFHYENERLVCEDEAYFYKLYQNVTRARLRLCLLIYDNQELFQELIEIKAKTI